jgi:hypothetical protein
MTQFSTSPIVARMGSAAAPASREIARRQIDDMVQKNRAATPDGVDEQRDVQRLSISELNALSLEDVRDRYHGSRRDTRPPVVRFLDLIDLPRNAIANVVFRGTAKGSEETAAFGMPRVYFSDVLENMGVRSPLARGVVGFVGDLAMDPLTYLGPAGWGAKLGTKAGQSVHLGASGARSIKKVAKHVAKGGSLDGVRSPETRALFEAAGLTDRRLERMRRAAAARGGDPEKVVEAVVRKRVEGSVKTGGSRFTRVLKERETGGGVLAKYFGQTAEKGTLKAERIKAADDFVTKYGKASAPGVRIGPGGVEFRGAQQGGVPRVRASSTIAHIPFTEYGIHVPGFTATGRAAQGALTLATADKIGVVAGKSPRVILADDVAHGIERMTQDAVAKTEEANEYLKIPGAEMLYDQAMEEVGDLVDVAKNDLKKIEQQWQPGVDIDTTNPKAVGEFLVLGKLYREARAKAEWAASKAKDMKGTPLEDLYAASARANLNLANVTQVSVANFLSTADREVLDVVKAALGVQDDVIGIAALAGPRAAARYAGASDVGTMVHTLDRTNAAMRRAHGQRDNLLHHQFRVMQNTTMQGGVETATREANSLGKQMRMAMDASDIPIEAFDEVDAVITAMMIHQRNLMSGEEGVYWAHKFGSTDPSVWMQKLIDAKAKGWFDESLHPGFLKALEGIADANIHMLDSLGAVERSDDILDVMQGGYIANVIRPSTKRPVSETRRAFGKLADSAGTGSEQFQKHRTTHQTRFTDPETGKEHRFFEFQRHWLNERDDVLAVLKAGDPAAYDQAMEARETIQRYEKLLEEGHEMPVAYPTDPFELNELAQNGAFAMLDGGLGQPFFEESSISMMAGRVGAHERAASKANFKRVVEETGLAIDREFLRRNMQKVGSEYVDPRSGLKAKIGHTSNGQPVLIIGGERYRKVSDEYVRGGNPVLEAMGHGSLDYVYPEPVADIIERSLNLFGNEESTAATLRAIDTVTSHWKSVTLMHPAWTSVNIVGDTLNALAGGARSIDFVKHAKNVLRAVWAKTPEELQDIKFNVRGQTLTGEELMNTAKTHRLSDTNAHIETWYQLNLRNKTPLRSHRKGQTPNVFQMARHPARTGADIKQDAIGLMSDALHGASNADPVTASGRVIGDRWMNGVVSPWFRLNQKVTDSIRMMTYLSHLEQGNDVATAVQRTIRSLFDYTDLTPTERNVWRRLFPFISWMRNNTAYQVKLLLERPIYAGSAPLVQNALEEAFASEERVPMHKRPRWMREQIAIQLGSDPNAAQSILFRPMTPMEGIYEMGSGVMGLEGMQDMLHYFASSLNPMIRSPLEVGAGREFFTGREISARPHEGDIGVIEYGLSQARPFREFGVGSPREGPLVRAFRKSPVQGASRLLIGGRVQPFDQERLAYGVEREYRREEQNIRSKIRLAQREKNERLLVSSLTALMQLYAEMQAGGFDIPAWAREQLPQVTGRGPVSV